MDWANAKRSQPIKLVDREDEAFDGLEAVHVYQVLLRAFAVNFTGSIGRTDSPSPPEPEYRIAEFANIPAFFAVPIGAGIGGLSLEACKGYHPDGSPRVTLDEVCDYNEILCVRAENERRAMEAAKKKPPPMRGPR